ncbi:MAG: UDP-N-acetylmuramoyl-tripeptide--D-alanyl-D-alanine ligase [Thermodesulfovibrionales bacterium]|nr:UDP-N-acetylmuramoyl-tripeptide--D-alanyl-D-alanine ligase [Thermodesulfovibrionales bacterium]
MGTITIEDVMTATQGKIISRGQEIFTGLSIDSRTIQEGALFIALRGKNFDGHDYLEKALERGNGAVAERDHQSTVRGKTLIHVEDTLKALQDIAHHMRRKRDIPVVAITGSNGKTTTKELTAAVLGTEHRILKNTGNLNNQIGLPLSLAEISDAEEMIVLEMGASAPGDILELCAIAAPGIGVLTNINYTHLESFRDLETIRRTKLEILGSVHTVVVNADDLFLMEGLNQSGYRGRVIRYGIQQEAEVRAVDIQLYDTGARFQILFRGKELLRINPKISGVFNIYNILAAASVGDLLNIALSHIRDGIESFPGVPMRLQLREMNGILIISDVYNANPASMEAALRELVRIKKGRTIAVLGDMLELGTYAEEAHRKIGRLLSELSVDVFIAVGPLMSFAVSEYTGDVLTAAKPEDAGNLLKGIGKVGDTVLVKGSRGMRMERVLADGS